ncbi:uncharacterized protein LOC126786043 isoform X2 [Argentina anserina]|uniref:uncharacterized protein LOC126786043 isoform X2 n=1 Tax=Argentina anserina TaxID=57926 RepID=UPI00217646A3|nr:uncharacterized protein LOC126786043 isoform X2 [Potentilla anserina]
MREKNPGFNKALQDGKLQIPISFAKKYICSLGETEKVNLRIPNGETYSAEISVKNYVGCNDSAKTRGGLGGWIKLARDTHLHVGDEIVLEMIEQQPKITFKVHIFRA